MIQPHCEKFQQETFNDYEPKEIRCIKALLAAVIERAIDDFHSTGDLQNAARCWLSDDATAEMSFIWCCQALDQCPITCRNCILNKTYVPPVETRGRPRITSRKTHL